MHLRNRDYPPPFRDRSACNGTGHQITTDVVNLAQYADVTTTITLTRSDFRRMLTGQTGSCPFGKPVSWANGYPAIAAMLT